MSAVLRKLIPLGDRILIKRIEPVVQTAAGIYLPDAKKTNEGEVVAVGPGAKTSEGALISLQCKVGDKVLLPEYGGNSIKLGSEEFHLFRDDDILGKFE